MRFQTSGQKSPFSVYSDGSLEPHPGWLNRDERQTVIARGLRDLARELGFSGQGDHLRFPFETWGSRAPRVIETLAKLLGLSA